VADPLSPAVLRVREALRQLGSAAEPVQLEGTARSAAEAASAIGCSVAQIAKSLVFRAADGSAVLVVASGANRVAEAKVAAALGQAIGKADAEFVRQATGFAIGGVPPVGHATALRVFLDADLRRLDPIWAAAGHPHAVFRTTAAELERLTGGRVIELAAG
jgi:prolyl-tRNA editing enzyme YbaK/EbsC (Cys-tRNA(Pro) deacylase)